jgi:mitochondrial chaperone BCS1
LARSLLFATTNHIDRLDPALSRPGRMDVWVNFANATKWQAKGIFKCFFPYKPSSETTQASPATTEQNLPLPRRKSVAPNIPLLSEDELNELAERFSAAIPEDELSVCPLHGRSPLKLID